MANYYLGHTGEELDEAIRRVLSGELNVPLQEKRVTPTTSEQIVAPDSDYKGLSRVTVEGIPQSYTDEVYNQGYEAGYNAEKPYQMELDYIQSSGTQYIDTGFKPNQNTRVLIDTEVISSGTTFLFGSRHNSSANSTSYSFSMVQISGTSLRSDYGSSETGVSVNPIQRLVIDKNKNVTTINGTSVSTTVQTFQSSYNLCLFTVNTAGTINSTKTLARLYSCQIYDNGTLVRDYIPVLDWNGVACLFDKVNQTFAYNSGTGKFGSNRYTPLEYIESTGTQYIDTGITPTKTMKVVVEITPLSTGLAENAIFGSSWSASGFFLMFYQNKIRWHSKGASVDVSSFNTTGRNTIEASPVGLVVNGTNYPIGGTGTDSTNNIYLFACGSMSGYESKRGIYKLHTCRIYDNDILIRDYTPVLDPNGVPCLYDKVNKTFAYNSGTGAFKYPGSRFVVNSITTTGSYDSASYHGDYWAAIDDNGNLLLVVTGGTNTSYESIYFTTSSIPSGVTFLKQSYYSYASMSVSVPYVAVFSGITSSVDITLNFSGTNTSSDYVTCTVTIT